MAIGSSLGLPLVMTSATNPRANSENHFRPVSGWTIETLADWIGSGHPTSSRDYFLHRADPDTITGLPQRSAGEDIARDHRRPKGNLSRGTARRAGSDGHPHLG